MSYLMNCLAYLMLQENIKEYCKNKEKKGKEMFTIKDLKVGDKLKVKGDNIILIIRYIDLENRYILVSFGSGEPYLIRDTTLRFYEKYKEHKKLKWTEWTEWKKGVAVYTNPFNEMQVVLPYEIRNNGKCVQVRSGSTKAFASCDETKGDKFDYKFGKDLALNRLIIKRISEGLEASVK